MAQLPKKNVAYIVLGGYGEMGSITVRDLLETTEQNEIWIVGHDAKKAQNFGRSFKSPRVKWAAVDVSNIQKLTNFFYRIKKRGGGSQGTPICINATQYYWNLHVMKACLAAHVPYLDLGGLFRMTKKQLKLHKKFKKAGLMAILGCGATPGITNIMAACGASRLDRVHEIHVKFAGKDFEVGKKFGRSSTSATAVAPSTTGIIPPFVLPYSAQTILDEFSLPAAKFMKRKLTMIEPFSDETQEKFPKPIGKVPCGSVLHSELATFPKSFAKKSLRSCSFQASFHQDFMNFFKLLVRLGLHREPFRKQTIEALNALVPQKKGKDLEILRVTLIGLKHGKKKKIMVDCVAQSNPRWNAPAGTVDTAVPPSIIAQMIANGFIQQPGVYPPELCIPPEPFFRELRKRKMKINLL